MDHRPINTCPQFAKVLRGRTQLGRPFCRSQAVGIQAQQDRCLAEWWEGLPGGHRLVVSKS